MPFHHFDEENKDNEAWEKHCARARRCRSCNARIIWFKTKRGKWMPVNFISVDPEDTEYDREKHISHFATCEYAGKHRKGRGETSRARR